MHPMLMILSAFFIISSQSSFGFWFPMSMPISFIAAAARGLI
jgi:hypothetical protein